MNNLKVLTFGAVLLVIGILVLKGVINCKSKVEPLTNNNLELNSRMVDFV